MHVANHPDLSHLWRELPKEVLEEIFSHPEEVRRLASEALHLALPDLDSTYIEHVVVAAMLTSLAVDQRPAMPMLDPDLFSKNAALPEFLWGLLYDDWAPDPTKGTTVFVTGYDQRSLPPDADPPLAANLRKRIYWSALTPDLLAQYVPKILPFFKQLLAQGNVGKPLMGLYLDSYYKELYWDLHVGVTGQDLPEFAVEIGQSFNVVLANATPTMQLVYDNYMKVRSLRPQLDEWLQQQVAALAEQPDPTTIVNYWLQNSKLGQDENFRIADIMFESFHDFVALSQWGNMIWHTVQLLDVTDGNPQVQAAFEAAMQAPPDDGPFDALDRFIMELFRFINPNSASISTFTAPAVTNSPFEVYRYVFTPHAAASMYELHWTDPGVFRPDRFLEVPLAAENDAQRSAEIGFATCPFSQESFKVADGRDVEITNSLFGTAYPVVDGSATPICDYAGYAPFGFGYRRCPGELLNVQVMRLFLQIAWSLKLEFYKLDISDPVMQPAGPLLVVPDVYAFRYPS